MGSRGPKHAARIKRQLVEIANEIDVGTVTIGSIGGDVAHDAVDANDPLKIGGKASSSVPSAVSDADRVDAYFDLNGRQAVFGTGDVAHDAVDSGNPTKIGGVATTTVPTAVGTGDRVDAYFDVNGRQQVSINDFGLEVGLGNKPGYAKVNKFGAALDCDLNTPTDIWDGADGTTSTDVWVAPTQARTHTIATDSTADDFSDSGTGARTVRVYGLADWDSAESNEDIELDGNGANAQVTSGSYVIIHRIVCLTFGSGGTNAGTITATATTDGTITAAIQPGEGQTLMCIYGVPSTQTIHIFGMRADVLRSVTTTIADMTLLVKENADLATSGFITKEKFQFGSNSPLERSYNPLKSFTGPCVLKMQVNAAANNSQVTAAFDAYLVDN